MSTPHQRIATLLRDLAAAFDQLDTGKPRKRELA